MTTPESSNASEGLLSALHRVRATSAKYDPAKGEVVIRLNTGLSLAFMPGHAAGLERAQASDLQQIEVSPSGLGLHFPALDADLYVPSILVGILHPQQLAEGRASVTEMSVPQPEDLYTYAVRWSAEDQEFVATCTELPSISWLASSCDQALLGVRRLVATIVVDMAEEGQRPLPGIHATE
jgi:Protein of unknown function (DUF2442)